MGNIYQPKSDGNQNPNNPPKSGSNAYKEDKKIVLNVDVTNDIIQPLFDAIDLEKNDNKISNQEKHYLLQFLLACCSVQDSIDEESRGEKMACFMDTLISHKMAELIQKAQKYFFGDEVEE